jgi:hypothetical protein
MARNKKNYKKGKEKSFFREIIVPVIVAIAVSAITTLITMYAQNEYERPKLKVLGAMPLHLYSVLKGPSGVDFRVHKLALILKIENSSPTPAMVHMAMLEGCVKIPPEVADSHLPEKDQIPSGTNVDVYYDKYKNSIQRISASAIVRQDTQSLPARGISYIGVLFPFGGQGAYHTVKGSVSFEGICADITTPNSHPAISQVLDIQRIHYDFPKGLRNEFSTGKITITLFVGSDQISIFPELLKPLKSIKADKWEDLALPQMYENPDKSYPPLTQNE